MNKILIVIVTHNSQRFLSWVLEPIYECSDFCDVTIVDSGSHSKAYLDKLNNVRVIFCDNIGFAKANNKAIIGLEDDDRYKYILFLNPDARIERENLRKLWEDIEKNDKAVDDDVGLYSVPLVKYDFDKMKPEITFDSLGIKCDLFGRWKDIRCKVSEVKEYTFDAVCGAFMLFKKDAIMNIKTKEGYIGFDESLFMYKEDIEISLRLKRKYKIKMMYNNYAYHCRGWNKKRKDIPYWSRKISAINDIKVNMRYKKRSLPYSVIKYLYVVLFERG